MHFTSLRVCTHIQRSSYCRWTLTPFFMHKCMTALRYKDSSVFIVTGYGLDDQGAGSLSPGRVPRVLCQGVKQLEREADHSPPTNAEVKKMCIYTSTTPYIFMACCLIKHRDKFTFCWDIRNEYSFMNIPSLFYFCVTWLFFTRLTDLNWLADFMTLSISATFHRTFNFSFSFCGMEVCRLFKQ
jgi:hypothetical protein